MTTSDLRRFVACACFMVSILFLSAALDLENPFSTGLDVIAGLACYVLGVRIAQTV